MLYELDLESLFNYIHLIPAQKNLADIMIFMVEHLLGTCLNSSLQAQRKITVLLARSAVLDLHAGLKVLGFKKTFFNLEDA